jgi:hypothetical protein
MAFLCYRDYPSFLKDENPLTATPTHTPEKTPSNHIAGLGGDAAADVLSVGGCARLLVQGGGAERGRRGGDQERHAGDRGAVRLRVPGGGEGDAPAGADIALWGRKGSSTSKEQGFSPVHIVVTLF